MRSFAVPSTSQHRCSLAATNRRPRRSHIVRASAESTECTIEVQTQQGPQTVGCERNSNLRKTLIASKLEVYEGTWNKMMNCGGAGNCGTCIVEVVEGSDFLSNRTATEDKKLSKKPANYRLACQTLVGEDEQGNLGRVVVRTLPK